MTDGCGILLVGCGKMGGAMLSGWLRSRIADWVDVIEPQFAEDGDGEGSSGSDHAAARTGGRPAGNEHTRVRVVADAASLAPDCLPDAIVLAVKPQVMAQAMVGLARFAGPDTVVLSIAAGKTLSGLEGMLGKELAVVRAMPNTPAAIGRGITVAVPNAHTTAAQRDLCDRLLRAVGEVEWVTREELLDPVTALSGGGPAYVFLLIETLAAAGERAGLPKDLSYRLARQTVIGAGALAGESDEEAAVLRRNVTSPKGTTEAALRVLMADDALQPLFDKAIAAATARSRELAD